MMILAGTFFVLAAAAQPLVPVKDVPFRPSFESTGREDSEVAFHPSLQIGYAASSDHLFVFDAADGRDLGGFELGTIVAAPYVPEWSVTVAGGRLVAWWEPANTVVSFSLDDPTAPSPLVTSKRWTRPRVRRSSSGEFLFVASEANVVDVVDPRTLETVASFGPTLWPLGVVQPRPVVGGTGSGAWIALAEHRLGSPMQYRISAWSLGPGGPTLRFQRDVPSYVDSMAADAIGTRLVAAWGDAANRHVESIDPVSGETLAAWTADREAELEMSEVQGCILLQVDPRGIDFVDLADPAAPRPVGRVGRRSSSWLRGWRGFAVSRTSPLVVATSGPDREVLAIDPRSATVLASLPITDAHPVGLVMGDRPDGTRSLATIGRRVDETGLISRGGLTQVDLADLSAPASPRATGRFLRNEPSNVRAVAIAGGRFGLAYDPDANALALADLSSGKVLEVTGARTPVGEFEASSRPVLRAAGNVVLVAGPRRWERFRLRDGRLEPLDSEAPSPTVWESYEFVDLSPSGTVVALRIRYEGAYVHELETIALDGRRGRASWSGAWRLRLAFSPQADRVAIVMPADFGDSPVEVWEIGDPSAPRLLWKRTAGVSDAAFDPTGSRLLVSGPWSGFTFETEVHDAGTGVSVNGPSQGIAKYFYHGLGTQWVADGRWRAVYWTWTRHAWSDVVVDLTASPPEVVRVLDHEESAPSFAAREGGGWYEVRWDPATRRSRVVTADPDGDTVVAPTTGIHGAPMPLRRGFVTTSRWIDGRVGFSVWRDPALNRPPVVVAEGDRTLECVDGGGALARFDASASWDPDSAPGTRDDVVAFAWSVDGERVSSDATVAAVLPVGDHDVAVEVRDALGASSSTSFVVAVGDHTAPEVQLRIGPALDGALWDRAFHPSTSVVDACDAAPRATMVVRLPEGAEAMEVSWERAVSSAVEIRLSRRGARVVLLGPDEASLRGAWDAALRAGGFAADATTRLESGGESRGVAWRFESGRAVAYGGRDLVVSATAVDASGNAASASASLSAARQAACKTPPPGSACVPR